ncbi:hypothetical protein Trydic_g15652 [Trypoxylus dichotomus]
MRMKKPWNPGNNHTAIIRPLFIPTKRNIASTRKIGSAERVDRHQVERDSVIVLRRPLRRSLNSSRRWSCNRLLNPMKPVLIACGLEDGGSSGKSRSYWPS